ncbi:MAG: DUF72 domain-containing protein [Sandaracinaceae bacterium]|nr:DUF72 domain-containing protein [Sandaracinaceae bacterium]
MSTRRGREQLGLFGGAGAADLEALPADPELVELASALPSGVRFGTSSWTFPGWQGLVYRRRYPSQAAFMRESLAEYARHPLLRTVGIDRSFYGPIPAAELAVYASMLPPGFRACMKVWERITTRVFPQHPRYGAAAGTANPDFLSPELFREHVADPVAAAFMDFIGPLILEIPPSRAPVDAVAWETALVRFLEAAPAELQYAVEVRDPALLTPGYFPILREHGATHVFNFWSRMPDIGQQLALPHSMPGPFVVARLMLPPGVTYEDARQRFAPFDKVVAPQPAMRADVIDLIERAVERGFEVYVVVNNKAEGSSPLTVRALAELLRSARETPPGCGRGPAH